jgi:hypothetical protein
MGLVNTRWKRQTVTFLEISTRDRQRLLPSLSHKKKKERICTSYAHASFQSRSPDVHKRRSSVTHCYLRRRHLQVTVLDRTGTSARSPFISSTPLRSRPSYLRSAWIRSCISSCRSSRHARHDLRTRPTSPSDGPTRRLVDRGQVLGDDLRWVMTYVDRKERDSSRSEICEKDLMSAESVST